MVERIEKITIRNRWWKRSIYPKIQVSCTPPSLLYTHTYPVFMCISQQNFAILRFDCVRVWEGNRIKSKKRWRRKVIDRDRARDCLHFVWNKNIFSNSVDVLSPMRKLLFFFIFSSTIKRWKYSTCGKATGHERCLDPL